MEVERGTASRGHPGLFRAPCTSRCSLSRGGVGSDGILRSLALLTPGDGKLIPSNSPRMASLFPGLPLGTRYGCQGCYFLTHDGTQERGNRASFSPTHELGVRWDPHDLLIAPPAPTHTSHWARSLPASGPLRPGQEAPPHLGQ